MHNIAQLIQLFPLLRVLALCVAMDAESGGGGGTGARPPRSRN